MTGTDVGRLERTDPDTPRQGLLGRGRTRAVCVVVCLLVLVIFLPYIKAEFLTWQHGSEFKDLYELTAMIDQIEYFKVVDYRRLPRSFMFRAGGWRVIS
jgi:hypothetical protein